MERDQIREAIERVRRTTEPHIELIERAPISEGRLGIFSSSFNPPTIAHVELIRQASKAFSLDATLALSGNANADKLSYDCPLEDRVAMMELAFSGDARTSIGLSSHAFYVDMIDPLECIYGARTDLHFIVGFDTFERVVDPGDQYTSRYHRGFSSRGQALEYLFERSSFIVAARGGVGLDTIELLLEREQVVPQDRVLYLDFPSDLGELSATEVRNRRRAGEAIDGLVPPAVQEFITGHELYTV